MIPGEAPSNPSEDFQDIDQDLDSLQSQYLTPIDALRSKVRPNLTNSSPADSKTFDALLAEDFQNLQKNNKSLESRINAFYRMLGFPVAAPDGSFYNPGFGDQVDHNQVNASLYNSKLQNFLYTRETSRDVYRELFPKANLNSCLFAILSRHSFPFAVFPTDQDGLSPSTQKLSVKEREEEANTLSSYNPSIQSAILAGGALFKDIRHDIVPLLVDPRVENTVIPMENKICVPFLKDKRNTKITKDQYLNRPGLELIIRQRIENQSEDLGFLKSAQDLITNKPMASANDSLNTAITAISILTDNNSIGENFSVEELSGVTDIQSYTVVKLLKSIKVACRELFEAYQALDRIQTKINWVPLPSQDGPITGSLGAGLYNSLKNSTQTIENRIATLKIKKLNAERQLSDFSSLGGFASPFSGSFSDNIKAYDTQIANLTNFQTQQFQEGMKALKTIEVVKGEVAGLGLVDVLAIYLALWSADLEVLLGLLDTRSFERLYQNNPGYRQVSAVVAKRAGSGLDLETALGILNNKIFFALTFADGYISNNQARSPAVSSPASI